MDARTVTNLGVQPGPDRERFRVLAVAQGDSTRLMQVLAWWTTR